MPTTFHKLNLKEQKEIVVLNAPESFEQELASLENVSIHRSPTHIAGSEFFLAFVVDQSQLDDLAKEVVTHTEADEIIWFAYPKQSSNRYKCSFNRDTGWHILKAAGFDTVRAVAIDEDWSAIRFRRIQFIKNSTSR